MQQLTKEQALIITAFTGVMSCPFSDFHEFVEKRLGRPIWTHEMGSPEFWEEIKQATKEDFLSICY